MDTIRFPIGQFKEYMNPDPEVIKAWVSDIEKTPALLRNSVSNLVESQLNKSYRLGGWTIRQIIHHVADNDMNIYFRFKRTLTEENPILPSFKQDKWAELMDYNESVEFSLNLIDSLYHRLLVLIRNLESHEFKRMMKSETYGVMNLETVIQRFLWHDRHHLAQILSLRNKEGW